MTALAPHYVARAIWSAAKGKEGAALERTADDAFDFILKNRLLGKAPEILAALERLCDTDRGLVRAKVTSRRPLAKRAADAVAVALKKRYGAREAALQFAEDPSLLGGIRVETENEVIDLSLKRKIEELRAYLTN